MDVDDDNAILSMLTQSTAGNGSSINKIKKSVNINLEANTTKQFHAASPSTSTSKSKSTSSLIGGTSSTDNHAPPSTLKLNIRSGTTATPTATTATGYTSRRDRKAAAALSAAGNNANQISAFNTPLTREGHASFNETPPSSQSQVRYVRAVNASLFDYT
jgi:hypothetical protein